MASFTLPGVSQFGTGLFGGAAASVAGTFIVSDLLYAAYREAGIMPRAGTGYSYEEAVDGLLVLNQMIDKWASDQTMVYSISRLLFSLVANQGSYTIGAGGDFSVTRPPRIEHAGAVLSLDQTPEVPMLIYSINQWRSVRGKAITDTLPRGLYYDSGAPLGTIYVWPVPSSTPQLALYLWQFVTEYESTDTQVTLPYGYRAALTYNLAVELAARFPLRVQKNATQLQLVIELARQGRQIIAALNADLFAPGGQV